MFNFLKKFFKSEEEPEIMTLKLDELKPFFNKNSKQLTENLNTKIKAIKGRISYEIEKTNENLKKLKKAELRNPNVPIRALQFMDGNREAYIKTSSHFVNDINIGDSYDSIIDFCGRFNDKLVTFAKSTSKAYKVLQEFFAHESRDVALNIKQLDNLIKELGRLINRKDLDKLKKLKEDILSINSKIEGKDNLIKELKEKHIAKEEKIKLKGNVEKLKTGLRGSNEYGELLSLVELKKKSFKDLEEIKARLAHSFAVINAALRKYVRMTMKDNELLDKYILDPLPTLLKDSELKIIDLLDGTRRSIMNASIELKDKKKDKILDEIAKLDKEYFTKFKKEFGKVKDKINELGDKISKNNSKDKLAEFDSKMEKINEDVVNIGKDMVNIEKDIGKIDFNDIKKDIEDKIKDVFGIELIIS